MRYMLLIYLDEQALDETERQKCYVESAQLAQEIHAKGQYLAAARCTRPRRPPASGCATANGS